MFAVTGTTGQVGGAVARALLAAKLMVRAVVRDNAKGAPWAARGCDIAIAELTDVAAMTAAFNGMEAVFILMPSNFDPEPGFPDSVKIDAAVHAALTAAQPRKVVCLSTIGAQATQPNLLNRLGLMERTLGTVPMPVAFLRAGWFMENSKWDVAPARDNGVLQSFLQPLDKPVPMVATTDVGGVAAEMLQEDWTGRKVVELEGPRRITPNEIAASFTKVLEKPIRIETVARDSWEGLFRAQGMTHPTPRMRMLDGFNAGWIEFETPSETRKGETDFETVLRQLI
ncbi:NmrA family NAD(P)-binding protein [Bradyrhizobium prioriisuperbiae]|uniref:NmrA family NAD(P)-binding protein n=1 Tax=Bradyrhizobium prioriisuperbiae TaxID=2854389 RepID=UPI0028E36010|nr:NmrA family NAD(P)-binding protein [Bradyrhizobium prioritasuperba]